MFRQARPTAPLLPPYAGGRQRTRGGRGALALSLALNALLLLWMAYSTFWGGGTTARAEAGLQAVPPAGAAAGRQPSPTSSSDAEALLDGLLQQTAVSEWAACFS